MRARRTLFAGLATLGLFAGVMPAAQADTTTDTYIVQLKSTVSASSVAPPILGSDATVLGNIHTAIAELTAAKAASVAANPNVISVRKDIKVKATGTETGAPWDLDLLDSRTGATDTTYTYPNTGTGVTVYVIDSGLIATHTEFASAHILPGINFVPNIIPKYVPDPITQLPVVDHYCGPGSVADSTVDPANTVDQVGHGTAVSSLVVGARDGVAKGANLVPVRMLDCDGEGDGADYVSAVSWIIANHTPGTPAVVNVSLGGAGTVLNSYTQMLIAAGITVVAAAGNENIDACNVTPASTPGAITAAAITPSLTEPSWPDGQSTNYGSCVDLYAPGDQVVVANWKLASGNSLDQGTSFSSPLIAGAAAQVLADHPTWTPAQVSADLSDRATYGAITGARSVNKLLNVGPLGTFTGTAPTIAAGVRVYDVASVQLHWLPAPLTTDLKQGAVVIKPASTYQWNLDDVAIPGATKATYQTALADQGKSLTVTVTGSYPGYADTAPTTSNAVVIAPPPPPGLVSSLAPTRLVDTRTGVGASGPLTNGRTVTIPVAGIGGVSPVASAVLVNITCTSATGSGFITGYASGTQVPGVSNANFVAGKTAANLALAPVGADGAIALKAGVNGGTVQLIVDLQGYVTGGGEVTEAGAVVPVAPQRLADTRVSGSLAGGGSMDVPVTGEALGVPLDAAAVFLNVTVTSPGRTGFLTAYPTGEVQPATSNLNFVPGQTVPNMALVKVGADGKVSIYNASATAVHVIVDIQGYVTAGEPTAPGALIPISPSRVLDTRVGLGAARGAVVSGTTRTITLPGTGSGTPSGVIMNLTATEPTGSGYVSAYPASGTKPTVSNLNYDAGATVPNLASVGLTNGQATLFAAAGSYGSVQIVADVFAYIL